MLISIVNHTSGKLTDENVQDGIRAVNRQIAHDFSPHWHLDGELRLEGAVGDDPDKQSLRELRGDAIIYLWDGVDIPGALGYHDAVASGVPFGFVFTELVKQYGSRATAASAAPVDMTCSDLPLGVLDFLVRELHHVLND